MEFIRYKPGEAIVSFATAPIKSRGLSERPEWKLGQASPETREMGRPGLEVPVGGGFKGIMAFPQSPLLTSVFPLSKKAR